MSGRTPEGGAGGAAAMAGQSRSRQTQRGPAWASSSLRQTALTCPSCELAGNSARHSESNTLKDALTRTIDAKAKAMIEAVRRGDQVVTGGGLVGKVVRVDEVYADIELALEKTSLDQLGKAELLALNTPGEAGAMVSPCSRIVPASGW